VAHPFHRGRSFRVHRHVVAALVGGDACL
jgi:hypothetical protein